MDKFGTNILNFVTGTASVIFWFVVLLIPLVVIHEFGHLIMARLVGVKVPEFAVGLPFSRRLFYKKWKGIIWSFYPWLLGGFVRLSGDNDAIDNAHWELNNKEIDKRTVAQNYTNSRRDEILQAQELQFFIEQNHLVWDQRWQWFEKISGRMENPKSFEVLPDWLVPKTTPNSVQDVKFVPKSKQKNQKVESKTDQKNENISSVGNEDSENEINSINLENSQSKNSESELSLERKKEIITKEYASLDDQLKTLIDWEFDSRMENKNEYFFAKNWWQQSLIISGGVLFNLLTAMVVFWIVFVFFGSFPTPYNKSGDPYFPDKIFQSIKIDQDKKNLNGGIYGSYNDHPQVISLEKDGVLDKAGIKPRDILLKLGENSLDSNSVKSFEEFKNVVQKYKDQTVDLTYSPPNPEGDSTKFKTVQIKPATNKDGQAVLGVMPAYVVSFKAANWSAGISMAVGEIGETFKLTFEWFGKVGQIITFQTQDRSALAQTSGPVGVGFIGSKIFEIAGFGGILYLIGAISVSLAIFNMLPIPALDGGRFIILTINKLTGKRNKKLEGALIGFTFILLFGMMILVAFKDLWSIISPK